MICKQSLVQNIHSYTRLDVRVCEYRINDQTIRLNNTTIKQQCQNKCSLAFTFHETIIQSSVPDIELLPFSASLYTQDTSYGP